MKVLSDNKYLEGRHTITIEKLYYEISWFKNNEDSTLTPIDDDSHLVLLKASDSIIHIPFYIYR